MPFAYKSNGVLIGTLIIAVAGLTAGFGLFLQGLASEYVPRGHASFFAVAKKTYPSLAVLFDIAISIKCFGVAVSYIIIIGDLMPQIAQSFGAEHQMLLDRQFWVAVSFSIVGPLSFLRKLDSLKYTSFVALASVAYLILIVVIHFLLGDTADQRGPIKIAKPEGPTAMLSALPVIVFAFTCHQNMFSVLNELKDYSHHKLKQIITGSIGSSVLMYWVVGLCGYFSFGDNVGGNIISMYPYNIFSTIGRIAIVVLVIFSYPLQCHPCRFSANHVIHAVKQTLQKHQFTAVAGEEDSINSSDEEAARPTAMVSVPLETGTFIVLTTIILILSLIVALSVSSLELMLAFVGATGSTSISFILPGVFVFTLLGKKEKATIGGLNGKDKLIRYASLALMIWGIAVAIVCFSSNIYMLVKS